MKRLVLGIVAHVDAGKTTLSEALLYQSGAIRRLGRVDHGDAFLDTDALERARGITIFSKQAVLEAPDAEFTLLDTPGHADLSAEMERTLQVLDYAVLVVSGTDGVQSHTETLWKLLARYRVPVLVFVNKMDLPGAKRAAVLENLRLRLGDGFFDAAAPRTDAWAEQLALCSEPLMETVLAGRLPDDAALAAAAARREVFPCWFGSALKMEGVAEFWQGLSRCTCQPAAGETFGARVYKIAEDDQHRRLTFFKVTGGALRAKTMLSGTDADGAPWQEKADQLRRYSGTKFTLVETALPGMVCAATGLTHTLPGDGLGAEEGAVRPLLEPVLTYRVTPTAGTDVHGVLTALRRLEQEDPLLHVVWNAVLGEVHVQLMGEIQLEILQSVLQNRFGLAVTFDEGGILYKETLTAPAEGAGHYEPLRHYAEVHLLLEPGAPGSGLTLRADCREETLDKNWQRLVLSHLREKTLCGVLMNAPLTDVKITLTAGRAHVKHTEGGDFRQATYRAVRQGLLTAREAGAVRLLEPWYSFRLTVPADAVGRALADLQRLNAEFGAPEQAGEQAVITGSAPAATLRGYPQELAAYTHGRGALSCTLKGYLPCHNEAEVLAAAAYDPERDTADPADSVFCSHGAGYVVGWREAAAQMHVQMDRLRPDGDELSGQTPARARRSAYRGTLAEDKELMAIFERTYGPVHKNRRTALAPVQKPTAAPASAAAAPAPGGPEYLLVDGYNIIFAWPELAAIARENLDGARRRLMDMVCNFCGWRRCRGILVFDAYRVKGGAETVEAYHNIHVVYTREAETADRYIERATHELGHKFRVRVATSDGAEQWIILGNGALRLSARQFLQEMQAAEGEIREYLAGSEG